MSCSPKPTAVRYDDVDRPDYLHFDLDPVPGADFEKVVEAALTIRAALESLKKSRMMLLPRCPEDFLPQL